MSKKLILYLLFCILAIGACTKNKNSSTPADQAPKPRPQEIVQNPKRSCSSLEQAELERFLTNWEKEIAQILLKFKEPQDVKILAARKMSLLIQSLAIDSLSKNFQAQELRLLKTYWHNRDRRPFRVSVFEIANCEDTLNIPRRKP